MSFFDTIMGTMGILGTSIVESQLLEPGPKLKLSPECPVSDEFRAEMDAWLLERFGTCGQQIVMLPGGRIAVSPSIARALRSLQ